MSNMSILQRSKGTKWRRHLANSAMPEGHRIYLHQYGTPWSNDFAVIYSGPNLGEPFDSAYRRGAQAVWDALQNRRAPKNAAERAALVKKMNDLFWE